MYSLRLLIPDPSRQKISQKLSAHSISRPPFTPLERAKISLVRHSDELREFDELVKSLKPVLASLVSCGILKDDSWRVTGAWSLDQKYRPKDLGSLLEILVYERPSD